MIRRRKLTPRRRSSLLYKQAATFGIGETRDERRRREDEHEAYIINSVHTHIWETRLACQLCHGARRRSCLGPDQMHEDPSRAQTRGLPAEERFNLSVCGRLCEACHRDVTENRIRIVFADRALGFLGPVTGEAT